MIYPDYNFENNKCKINTISSGLIILKNDYNYFSQPPIIINICDNNKKFRNRILHDHNKKVSSPNSFTVFEY